MRTRTGCIPHVLERPCVVGNGLLDVCLGYAYAWADKIWIISCVTVGASVHVTMLAVVVMVVTAAVVMVLTMIRVHSFPPVINM